jgi:hypothetical protein
MTSQSTAVDGSNYTKVLYCCEDCGHVQSVTHVEVDGVTYVGSRSNWCDACGDGLPIQIKEGDVLHRYPRRGKNVVSKVAFYPDDGFPLCDGYMVGEDDGKSPLYPTADEAIAAYVQANPNLALVKSTQDALICKIMCRLADLLDDDHFNEISCMVESAGVCPSQITEDLK